VFGFCNEPNTFQKGSKGETVVEGKDNWKKGGGIPHGGIRVFNRGRILNLWAEKGKRGK